MHRQQQHTAISKLSSVLEASMHALLTPPDTQVRLSAASLRQQQSNLAATGTEA
jgi:hypothetical protein